MLAGSTFYPWRPWLWTYQFYSLESLTFTLEFLLILWNLHSCKSPPLSMPASPHNLFWPCINSDTNLSLPVKHPQKLPLPQKIISEQSNLYLRFYTSNKGLIAHPTTNNLHLLLCNCFPFKVLVWIFMPFRLSAPHPHPPEQCPTLLALPPPS